MARFAVAEEIAAQAEDWKESIETVVRCLYEDETITLNAGENVLLIGRVGHLTVEP